MIHFAELERQGIRAAAMSGEAEGDCAVLDGVQRFCAELGIDPKRIVRGEQVHGTRIQRVQESDAGTTFADTDGFVTDARGLPIAVFAADCVPLLLSDPVRKAVGAFHAGRVGTFDGMARKGVEALSAAYGTRPGDIHAVVGPSAGPESYEVSEELAREFVERGHIAQGRYLDLWETNVRQLAAAGVPRDQITVSGVDTIQDLRFFSYRRTGTGARNMAVLMV